MGLVEVTCTEVGRHVIVRSCLTACIHGEDICVREIGIMRCDVMECIVVKYIHLVVQFGHSTLLRNVVYLKRVVSSDNNEDNNEDNNDNNDNICRHSLYS